MAQNLITKKGLCRLCLQNKELRVSHLVPKFFYNQLKKKSITGMMRDNINPNVPTQDGYKIYFLCASCKERVLQFVNDLYTEVNQETLKGEFSEGAELVKILSEKFDRLDGIELQDGSEVPTNCKDYSGKNNTTNKASCNT